MAISLEIFWRENIKMAGKVVKKKKPSKMKRAIKKRSDKVLDMVKKETDISKYV